MRRNSKIEAAIARAERNRMCLWAHKSANSRLLRKRAQAGELLAVRSDLFVRPSYWQTLDPAEQIMHVLRSVADQHPSWTFGFLSAAAIWGLDRTIRLHDIVYVAVDDHTKTRDRGHLRFVYLPNAQTQQRNGLRVTSLLQTVFDCIRTLPFPEALAICDAAMRQYGLTRDDLARFIDDHAGHRGVGRARTVLAHADARSENGGESIARAWFAIWGFAAPGLQEEIRDAVTGQMRRADFVWRLGKDRIAIGELDGREKYVNPIMLNGSDPVDVVLAEKERESNMQLTTNAVFVRIPFRQLMREPDTVQRKLNAAGVPRSGERIEPGMLQWRCWGSG